MIFKKLGLTLTIVVLAFSFLYSQSYNVKKAEELYMFQCSKCHRKSGSGVKDVYPPLKNADYIKNGNSVELIRGMIFGRSGRIVVNGIPYQGVMTTEIDKTLSDEDIALILTFVYQKLNGLNKVANTSDVKSARKAGKLPVHK